MFLPSSSLLKRCTLLSTRTRGFPVLLADFRATFSSLFKTITLATMSVIRVVKHNRIPRSISSPAPPPLCLSQFRTGATMKCFHLPLGLFSRRGQSASPRCIHNSKPFQGGGGKPRDRGVRRTWRHLLLDWPAWHPISWLSFLSPV